MFHLVKFCMIFQSLQRHTRRSQEPVSTDLDLTTPNPLGLPRCGNGLIGFHFHSTFAPTPTGVALPAVGHRRYRICATVTLGIVNNISSHNKTCIACATSPETVKRGAGCGTGC
jgi:hypothetical protein